MGICWRWPWPNQVTTTTMIPEQAFGHEKSSCRFCSPPTNNSLQTKNQNRVQPRRRCICTRLRLPLSVRMTYPRPSYTLLHLIQLVDDRLHSPESVELLNLVVCALALSIIQSLTQSIMILFLCVTSND